MPTGRYKYDAFVSHAVEDKLPIANELCLRLEKAGLRIWYSGKELKAGDSLERTILEALVESEYGIVILSPTYVERNWPMKEYYLLLAKEIEKGKVILPVFYNITPEDLSKYDIAIADKWGIRYEKGMEHVVEKLLEVIQGPVKKESHGVKSAWKKLLITLCVVFFLFGSYSAYHKYFSYGEPSREFIQKTIAERIRKLEFDIEKEHIASVSAEAVKPATMEDLKKIFQDYLAEKTNYRNAYEFRNGFRTMQSRKNVEALLKRDGDSLTPIYSYNLSSPNIFLATRSDRGKVMEAEFILLNTQPLSYDIIDQRSLGNGSYEVNVSYTNNVRYIFVELLLPSKQNVLKRHHVILKGTLPVEKYVFEKSSGNWFVKDVQ